MSGPISLPGERRPRRPPPEWLVVVASCGVGALAVQLRWADALPPPGPLDVVGGALAVGVLVWWALTPRRVR